MNNRLDLIRTTLSFTLLQSLKKMDEIRRKLLLVVDKEKYIGLLSIGDVQRAIINNTNFNLLLVRLCERTP